MIATHSRYSFHTSADGKNSFINDLAEHRTLTDGHYYWIVRLSEDDARKRSVGHGRSDLVAACPYGAIGWNAELQLPQNWIFDAHLLDLGWKQPRCEQVCPTGALVSTKLDDEGFERVKREQGLEEWSPSVNTRPNIVYKNLHRARSLAIFGSVATEAAGVEDCVAGARVRLLRDGAVIAEQVSDDFGDFKFDGLNSGDGSYMPAVENETGRNDVEIGKMLSSVALGDIRLR